MKYGLPIATIERMHAVLAQFPCVERAVLYGSRAKGNFKPGSDIDLTLFGEDLDSSQLGKIAGALDDLLLPYTIDLSIYDELNHAKLREHIDRVGVVFYERPAGGMSSGTAGVKKGWKTKTLEEACQFSNGLWKGEKPPFVNVGVIRNTNFTKEGTLDDSDIAYLDVEVKKLDKRRLQFGDIILEKSGGGPKQPVGRVALFDKEEGDFSFSNFTAALRVLDPDELDFRYLHKFLHWTYLSGVTEGMQSHSTGIRNLDGDAYKAIQVTYPPLPEQRRIVALLDEAFAGLATAQANAEKNLQNARALFESHLQSVFTHHGKGWVETTIGDAFDTSTGTTPPKGNASYYGDFMPFVKPPELCDAPLDSAADSLSEAGSEVARTLPPGSILVSCIGNLGKIGLNTVPVAFNQQINAILPDASRAIPELMFFQCLASSFKQQLEGLAGGTTVPIVNKSKFNSVRIVLPPLREQHAMVTHLDALSAETRRLAAIYEQKLAALAALKKSLLHQAFAGEL